MVSRAGWGSDGASGACPSMDNTVWAALRVRDTLLVCDSLRAGGLPLVQANVCRAGSGDRLRKSPKA